LEVAIETCGVPKLQFTLPPRSTQWSAAAIVVPSEASLSKTRTHFTVWPLVVRLSLHGVPHELDCSNIGLACVPCQSRAIL